MMVSIEPITPASTVTFREVRLSALRESPSAFGSTYAEELKLSDVEWQQRAERCSGDNSVGYLAIDSGQPCGIVACFLHPEDLTSAHLASMWVTPNYRSKGVGQLLVRTVFKWIEAHHVITLILTVTSSNDRAIRFYERLGFVKTGNIEPYPNDPALFEYEMVRFFKDIQEC
ncbi:N-acetyltransferase [Acaryochloris sp. CCMEE 5410]|uniref:GNAT family N-acetyltransferase n=1 Tax=Acaryochloris sp. CCMEE 5410 TaxID=310037 RepID=UPI000A2F0495|nr:GNAT family N-acetyltransferase [Acaryochloris sp. CCMEE 5410]KAI9129645.1 GNAT family N-acetyltransferase [Acaryochloris sp. CCMEE 5410]